ncbi:hypothetical protein RB653_003107 [Dictyostelium firmibasis]|uniref:SHSP domain-containing protein n=1 Tax=Dictyostelium firmibasis TaxID=79012 RepID=A0AAN7TRM3_9MYCE
MATLFDILNTLNNNGNNFKDCKKQYSINKNRIDFVPSMDVTMTNDKLIIETELAGVSKSDININIKDSILIIQGEKKKNSFKQQKLAIENSSLSSNNKEDEPSIEEFEEDVKPKLSSTTLDKTEIKVEEENEPKVNCKKFISERSFGNFKKHLNLSNILYQLDLNTINTQFENGLLTITINKRSDCSNTIKISIN